jgi:hypothetical protein
VPRIRPGCGRSTILGDGAQFRDLLKPLKLDSTTEDAWYEVISGVASRIRNYRLPVQTITVDDYESDRRLPLLRADKRNYATPGLDARGTTQAGLDREGDRPDTRFHEPPALSTAAGTTRKTAALGWMRPRARPASASDGCESDHMDDGAPVAVIVPLRTRTRAWTWTTAARLCRWRPSHSRDAKTTPEQAHSPDSFSGGPRRPAGEPGRRCRGGPRTRAHQTDARGGR